MNKSRFTLLERVSAQSCSSQPSFEKARAREPKKGFTLADVLITLVILGVISALTVPSLIQNTRKKEYTAALKKAYSALSQAAVHIIEEAGTPKCDNEGWACSADSVYTYFTKYLTALKKCGAETGCFSQQRVKLLNGQKENIVREGSGWRNFVAADGMQFGIHDSWVNKSCELAFPGGDIVYPNNLCAAIQADINGEKAPNKIGRDVFAFGLKEDGIVPLECSGENTCKTNSTGWSCACKVLTEDAMNY